MMDPITNAEVRHLMLQLGLGRCGGDLPPDNDLPFYPDFSPPSRSYRSTPYGVIPGVTNTPQPPADGQPRRPQTGQAPIP